MKRLELLIQKRFNIDTRYLFRGGFWLLLGHAFTMLAVLATSYFFANYVDEHTYGVYKYLVTVGILISVFSLSGLSSSVTQAAAKGYFSYYSDAMKLSNRYGLLVSLIAFIGAAYYFIQDNLTLSVGLVVIALFQPLMNSGALVSSYFIGRQQFSLNTNLHIFKTLLTTVFTLASILLSGDILVMLTTYLVSNIIANKICSFYVDIPSSDSNEIEEARLNKFAKHTSIQNMMAVFASQLDKILIFQNLGAPQLATYAFATALPDQYKGITKTIEMLVVPRFSNHSKESIKKNILYKSFIYLIFLILCLVAYIIVAPYIFSLLYPQYSEAVALSQVYVFGIIFGIGSLPLSALKTNLENKNLYTFNTITASVQILSLIVLLPLYGLWGAVISRIIYRAFVCFFAYYLYFKK